MSRRLVDAATGTVLVTALVVGAAVGFYYALLPANPGPDNSSPPPEAFGPPFGGFLGSAVGVALLVVVRRYRTVAFLSWWSAVAVICLGWVAFGSDTLGVRVLVAVLTIVVLGFGGWLGLALGGLAVAIATALRGHRAGPGATP